MNKTLCALLFFVVVIAFANVFSSYKNINEGFNAGETAKGVGLAIAGIGGFVLLIVFVASLGRS